jgi:hypothetical protein
LLGRRPAWPHFQENRVSKQSHTRHERLEPRAAGVASAEWGRPLRMPRSRVADTAAGACLGRDSATARGT